jgi:hypothetical protein
MGDHREPRHRARHGGQPPSPPGEASGEQEEGHEEGDGRIDAESAGRGEQGRLHRGQRGSHEREGTHAHRAPEDVEHRPEQHHLHAVHDVAGEGHVPAREVHRPAGEQGPGGEAVGVEVREPTLVEGQRVLRPGPRVRAEEVGVGVELPPGLVGVAADPLTLPRQERQGKQRRHRAEIEQQLALDGRERGHRWPEA